MQLSNSSLSRTEYNVLRELYITAKKAIGVSSSCVIWIDTPVEKCHKNIESRNRDGEGGISKEFLQDVDKFHREWLENRDDVHVVRIDGDIGIETLEAGAIELAKIVNDIYTEENE